jgi:hypothetical protein
MLPNCKIIVSKEGNSRVIGLEKSPYCSKLKVIGRNAGKVVKEIDKDHPPACQETHLKRR